LFINILDLNKYYLYFIYNSQLLLLESCFYIIIINPELNLNLSDLLYNFINNFFNNITSGPLSEILNNCLYYFRVNKDTSISNYINISRIKKKNYFL
jgi:hypothetical protein